MTINIFEHKDFANHETSCGFAMIKILGYKPLLVYTILF